MGNMKTLFVLLIAFAQFAIAQSSPRTFAVRSPTIPCGTSPTSAGADVMPLDNSNNWRIPSAVGTGSLPASFGITQVCLTHSIDGVQEDSHATAGHSGPNGDLMVPVITGTGTVCTNFNPPNQFIPGEYLDVHAGCRKGYHWVFLWIQYVSDTPGVDARALQDAPIESKYLYQGQWVVILSGTRVGTTVKVRLQNGLISTVDISDLQ